jgi:hypothetical protein
MTRTEPATKVTDQQQPVREVVGMRRWLRLTARKHSAAKQANNDASQAAADALALMLKDARKLG